MLCILLIGMREEESIRRGFHRATSLFRSCTTLEEAKPLLTGADLFLLDGCFGPKESRSFLRWTRENTNTIGIIVEDMLSNDLCIEAINSGIVCDYIIRPVSSERYEESLGKFKEMRCNQRLL